jgi:hypothetical protein
MMRRLLITIGAALAALALSGVPAVTASAASAATTPVIYNYDSGWHNADVPPAWVIVGQGGAPVAHTRHWSTWDKGEPNPHATAAGMLLVDNCVPNCARQGKTSYHKLVVTLSVVKTHNGVRYYSKMTWYTPGYWLLGYKTSTAVLHFSIPPGASVPGWG